MATHLQHGPKERDTWNWGKPDWLSGFVDANFYLDLGITNFLKGIFVCCLSGDHPKEDVKKWQSFL
jgi:hypothetical protein